MVCSIHSPSLQCSFCVCTSRIYQCWWTRQTYCLPRFCFIIVPRHHYQEWEVQVFHSGFWLSGVVCCLLKWCGFGEWRLCNVEVGMVSILVMTWLRLLMRPANLKLSGEESQIGIFDWAQILKLCPHIVDDVWMSTETVYTALTTEIIYLVDRPLIYGVDYVWSLTCSQ